jgi:hypothetical protein
MKTHLGETELFHGDRRMDGEADMTKPMGALHSALKHA